MFRKGWPLALLMACAGDSKEDETSVADQATDACLSQCEASGNGTGCDAAAVAAECPDLCALAVFFLSDDCLGNYESMLECQEGLSYVCDGTVTINGVDWPYPDDTTACADQEATYEDCFGTFTTTPTTTP